MRDTRNRSTVQREQGGPYAAGRAGVILAQNRIKPLSPTQEKKSEDIVEGTL